MKFLETVYPLEAEVYYSTQYDIKIYKTSHSFEEREHLTAGHPLGSAENRKKFYEKCCRHVTQNEPQKIQEFLFYDTKFEQGAVMAYRPDSLRKGLWCLVIITILPYRRHAVSPNHPTKKVLIENLMITSKMPSLTLQYVLEIAGEERIQAAIDEVNSMGFDAISFFGAYGIQIVLEKDGVKSIGTKWTHKNLKLIEI